MVLSSISFSSHHTFSLFTSKTSTLFDSVYNINLCAYVYRFRSLCEANTVQPQPHAQFVNDVVFFWETENHIRGTLEIYFDFDRNTHTSLLLLPVAGCDGEWTHDIFHAIGGGSAIWMTNKFSTNRSPIHILNSKKYHNNFPFGSHRTQFYIYDDSQSLYYYYILCVDADCRETRESFLYYIYQIYWFALDLGTYYIVPDT